MDRVCWSGALAGSIAWPIRLWLLFVDYIKTLMYETSVDSTEGLVARIVVATGEARDIHRIFQRIRRYMRRRCDACITARERYFEHIIRPALQLVDDTSKVFYFYFLFFYTMLIFIMYISYQNAYSFPFLVFYVYTTTSGKNFRHCIVVHSYKFVSLVQKHHIYE